MGFPNENKDNLIVESLLPSLDPYPHSEERRLPVCKHYPSKEESLCVANPTAPSDFCDGVTLTKIQDKCCFKSIQ